MNTPPRTKMRKLTRGVSRHDVRSSAKCAGVEVVDLAYSPRRKIKVLHTTDAVDTARLRCARCGFVWDVHVQPNGRFAAGWRRCPRFGCNAHVAGAARVRRVRVPTPVVWQGRTPRTIAEMEVAILASLPAAAATEAYERAGLPRPWYLAGHAWRRLGERREIARVDGVYVATAATAATAAAHGA